jgi:peroxiredoxin Q/BCP
VLYFYPKDSTPGCTTESQNFRDLHDAFVAAGGRAGHLPRQHQVPRQLLRQAGPALQPGVRPRRTACNLFGVMKMKNMYGKQVRGIERSTFVIDAAGVLRREWRGVKVPGHAQEVLDYVKTL